LFFANSALAALQVKPAKLGVIRLEIFPFSSASFTHDFIVGNRYNFPIKISLSPAGNVSEIIKLSEESFSLQPNETKTIEYTVSVKDPGIYTGGVAVEVKAGNRTASLVYQADLTVFASKSKTIPELYILPILAVVLAALIVYFRKPRRKK
ncbi:MAG: hypothetical protein HZA82_07045, partial [Thaumarchaeota archaeon]|nr:hypothetical protein [Nitrososphaerota archaeon]